ncbi:MAG: hypothetical protein MR766_04965 [Erysipelotrichaceae bacterium]|nr:hypothetical protein [Erysipelotrichaceae bacterium]
MSKKARNILSLITSFVSLALVITMGVVIYKKVQYNNELQQQKVNIEDYLADPDNQVYDIYIYDDYTVYDEKTIIEFSK